MDLLFLPSYGPSPAGALARFCAADYGAAHQLMERNMKNMLGVLCTLLVMGCSQEISSVKELPFPGHSGTTIGKVVDNFDDCEDKTWSEEETPQGEPYVEFTCRVLSTAGLGDAMVAYRDRWLKPESHDDKFVREGKEKARERNRVEFHFDVYYVAQWTLNREGYVAGEYTGTKYQWKDRHMHLPMSEDSFWEKLYANTLFYDKSKPSIVALLSAPIGAPSAYSRAVVTSVEDAGPEPKRGQEEDQRQEGLLKRLREWVSAMTGKKPEVVPEEENVSMRAETPTSSPADSTATTLPAVTLATALPSHLSGKWVGGSADGEVEMVLAANGSAFDATQSVAATGCAGELAGIGEVENGELVIRPRPDPMREGGDECRVKVQVTGETATTDPWRL